MNTLTTVLNRAVSLGWSIIPVGLDKKPLHTWKEYQTRKPNTEELKTWHSEKPAGWAVLTGELSGIVIIDFDGDQGRDTMYALSINPHVRTGSGGYHHYVNHPGHAIKTLNSKSKKELGEQLPGVDIRGDGGYAVFCGRNEAGEYEWIRDMNPDPWTALPENVQEIFGFIESNGNGNGHQQITATVNAPSDIQWLIDKYLREPGGRNDNGFRLAMQLRDNGFSQSEAEAAMRQYQNRVSPINTKGQSEPYTTSEAIASLREAYTKAPREPLRRPRTPDGRSTYESTPMPEDKDAPESEEPETNAFDSLIFSLPQWLARPRNDDWILNGLFRRGELVVLYGAPKAGKTFVAIDLLLSVALGDPWCGERYPNDQSGFVVIAIGEGQNGLDSRLAVATKVRDMEPGAIDSSLRVIPAVPQLYDQSSMLSADRLIEAVKRTGLLPDVLVIDTYARAIIGADENAARDAGVILAALQRIQQQLTCAVVAVHHAGKGGDLRGSTALMAGADVVIKCSKDGTQRKMEVEFAKDIPEQQPVTYDLMPAPDCDSVFVQWGNETTGSSMDERIIAFLKENFTRNYTAREIGEAIDVEQRIVIKRLWQLKGKGEVVNDLRHPDKSKSNQNPLEWTINVLPGESLL